MHGDPYDVFSDRNITDASNDVVFSLLGSGTRSYIAATMTQAVFGKLDWTWNDMIRFAGGARWEDYEQVALPWNRYGYSVDNPRISTDPGVIPSLIDNVFGERLYAAGRLGAPDGYEQPFHSLDLTYSWFPTETITVKAKLKNILDQSIEIQRESIITFEESPGSAFALSLKWEY